MAKFKMLRSSDAIKIGEKGNKFITVILLVLLLIMGTLALVNISKSLYSTAVTTGGLDAKETKDMLGNVMTIMIVTSLVSSIMLYLRGSPKFTSALLLSAIVSVCKAVIVMEYHVENWLLYLGMGALILSLAWVFKILSEILGVKE